MKNRLFCFFALECASFNGTVVQLLNQAGAENVQLETMNGWSRANCRWAGWNCAAHAVETAAHSGLLIDFRHRAFLSLVADEDQRVEEEPLWSLSSAFRRACENLQPEAAGIWTRPHLDVGGECEELSLLAINEDADGLLKQYYGALYLSRKLGAGTAALRRERDLLPCATGLIVYSGSGKDRWF